MPLVPLWESHEMYKRSFQAIIDNSTIRQSAMLSFTRDAAKEGLQKIIESVDPSKPLNVLGIGSGSGDTDLLILQSLAEYFASQGNKKPAFQSVIVEPSSVFLDQFKSKVSTLPPLLQENTASVSFEWHHKTFHEFHQATSERNRFDFIHFAHSIYYLDVEHTLRSCFEQYLKPDTGVIVCLVQTEDSCFVKVSRKFKGKLSLGSENMTFRADQELVSIAERHGWKYSVPLKEKFEIKVTSCLSGEPTAEGDHLLDFLTQQQDFRATADQNLFDSVIDFIDSLAYTKENGDKFIKGQNAAVIIYK